MEEKHFKYIQAIEILTEKIKEILQRVENKEEIQEIRLRINEPIMLMSKTGGYFINKHSKREENISQAYIINKLEIEEIFKIMCEYSIHSYEPEILQGYITIQGGHRVGFCGTAVKNESSKLINIKNISSINIRIAREKRGIGQEVVETILAERTKIEGILIIGPPSSGKTTLLRDITRIISEGINGVRQSISVIDERGEIAAVSGGIKNNNLGNGCDIYDGYPKAEAIKIAIRTMGPSIIVCDELGSKVEIDSVKESINSGVELISTVHGSSLQEVKNKDHVRELIGTGGFKWAVELYDRSRVGEIKSISMLF